MCDTEQHDDDRDVDDLSRALSTLHDEAAGLDDDGVNDGEDNDDDNDGDVKSLACCHRQHTSRIALSNRIQRNAQCVRTSAAYSVSSSSGNAEATRINEVCNNQQSQHTTHTKPDVVKVWQASSIRREMQRIEQIGCWWHAQLPSDASSLQRNSHKRSKNDFLIFRDIVNMHYVYSLSLCERRGTWKIFESCFAAHSIAQVVVSIESYLYIYCIMSESSTKLGELHTPHCFASSFVSFSSVLLLFCVLCADLALGDIITADNENRPKVQHAATHATSFVVAHCFCHFMLLCCVAVLLSAWSTWWSWWWLIITQQRQQQQQ